MRYLKTWWNDVSIARKLYLVFGIMATLIACELVTLQVAMHILSGARALVGGESLWSKAQKNAVYSLERYNATHNERDYETFLSYLKISEGDHHARLELMREKPDYALIEQGFMQGHIEREDIPAVFQLLHRFYWVSYLSHAIDAWVKADTYIDQLRGAASEMHNDIAARKTARAPQTLNQIKEINEKLTVVEEEFSYSLGIGSRWLEHVVLTMLTLAVLSVETIGLTLTFFTSRAISRGLNDLNSVSRRIGSGDFLATSQTQSRDEIGRLGKSINTMGRMLQKSYGELEAKVEHRTKELSLLVKENENLYKEAQAALKIRDEFLSIASHELKTPLTSLKMQTQMLQRKIIGEERELIPRARVNKFLEISDKQVNRLVTLIDDLLDISRIESGKISYNPERVNLGEMARDVLDRFDEAIRDSNQSYLTSIDDVWVWADKFRLEQILINLISNTMKYGGAKPIEISVFQKADRGMLTVKDSGLGIEPHIQPLIFNRFERGAMGVSISGLGLGLFISQEIAKAHNGIISVSSKPGEGSLFTFEIPRLV